MELDIDSFLDSPLSSDSDDDSSSLPHRTVDEILKQSDSSTSSSPPPSPPSTSLRHVRRPPQLDAVEQEPPQSDSKSAGVARAADPVWRIQSSSSSSAAPRQLPTLFGGVRSNAKPGAALAAAAAASRSVPTPHAAALKSRRASSVVSRNVVDGGDLGSSFGGEHVGVCSSNGDSVGVNSERIGAIEKLDVDDYNKIADLQSVEAEVNLSRQNEDERGELVQDTGEESHWKESENIDGNSISNDDNFLSKTTLLANLNMGQLNGSTKFDPKQTMNEMAAVSLADEVIDNEITALSVDGNSVFSNLNNLDKKDAYSSPGVGQGGDLEEDVIKLDSVDEEDMQTTSDVEQGGESDDDDASSISDISELVEQRIGQLESEIMSKKVEKDVQAPKKPLELAEELEKKQASTGLHLEEGAAAQPMRLEGVRRGSTTIGYFDVDAHNIVTGTISSQAFRRDHGSPQVLAVHSNYIAVGMSKGTIALVTSKYSPHHADNMDSKVLMLGVQGDRSLSPVTSMCFNQQGDLLLAGYADGHVTVWDILRTSIAKVIAGEHSSPVVHTFFLGQDSQATRQFKAVTGDNKGLVQLHTFSVLLLLNRFTIKTQCLLDGQRTSTVLSASPLLFDDSSGANVSTQGNSANSMIEEGVVIFVTHQSAVVMRLSPNLEVYAQLSRPEGVREGSMPYTAWKCGTHSCDSLENTPSEKVDRISLLALAWDRKVQVVKLVKSELKLYAKWSIDSSAVGVTWLDDQMLVVLTVTGQLYLFTRDGILIHQTSFIPDGFRGDDLISYHTHFINVFGNPEKSYHNCVAVRGASVYILGPMHLAISRLLPWKERIQVMQKAGDWMGALSMAMTLYDGRAPGVIDIPRNPDAVQEVIMPYLIELLLSYVDEVFSYISVAFCNQIGKAERVDNQTTRTNSLHSEIKEQFTRVGGVAVEFCVHIKRTDILFDEIFSRFVAVQHRDTFLELLEPYVLKDMLGSLPPEIMQALVEHYSSRGWLQRVEQCVLHMDISSLDFNQVARLCREHGLYSALIYIFNKGLDDFRTPLEELLVVLRNSVGETACALGYRMLIYLKYCFLGLAFPPGQGSLPPSRLSSLRVELLQFLLEVSDRQNEKPTILLSFGGQYLKLYFLLELDTEATLDVLRCAFAEADAPKLDSRLPDSSDTSEGPAKESDLVTISQNMLVQNIVDALVHIIEDISYTDGSAPRDENKLLETWPSPKDIAYLFEFVAYYVSCGRANVSKPVLHQVLQYLTSERGPVQIITTHSETSKRKEKQLLALLSVVPGTEWDQTYVLQMCDNAHFFQACGFIHAIRQQYIAALDSYIKDIDEPVHAFSFINDILLRLTGNEYDAFKSAVLSRIPELVNLSREGTFLLVLDHFNPEGQLILVELQAHPKSLFLYLKTAIEVHLSGTLNLSHLSKNEPAYASSGRKLKDQSTVIEAYLGRVSKLPKLLRSNPLHVTDDMIEQYLELLCQFERDSVLQFLETFDSYRVEHCLRLCQEYGITDAAAFLMERVGDVGSALLLTLAELDDKFLKLNAAVGSAVSRASLKKSARMEHLNTVMKMKEVDDIYGVLHACIGLCQRNTPRLNHEESEILWFRLLDAFCEPLMGSRSDDARASDEKVVGGPVKLLDLKDGKERHTVHWKISRSHRAAHILRKLFSRFIKEIVEGMIGYVHLPTIMSKLLSDNGSQEFGDFKHTILGMLGTNGFERRILDSAKSLIEDDTFYTMSLLRKGASHGYAPRSLLCCICNSSLIKNFSGFRVRVFNCGHATHLQCEILENESSIRGPSSGCPICLPKKNMQRSRNKSVRTENSLVSIFPSKDLRAQGSLHPHESDVLENSYGLQQIPRFEILVSLQKDQRIAQTESMPQLRLAPPAIYHEKVKKGMDLLAGESSSQLTATENPRKGGQLRDLRGKGSALRIPLKSSIFGKEKTSRR